jgi:hypothetical protein
MYDTLNPQMTGSFINFEAQQAVMPQLSSGERLLWAGRPRQGVFLQPQDAMMIPFSVAWGGFAIFWTYTAWRSGAPLFFVLWGTPFVAIGLYMMFGRFFSDAKARAKTFYAVTDQRILFVRGDSSSNQVVTSVDLKSMGEFTSVRNTDGRGTIVFNTGNQMTQQVAKAAAMFNRGNSTAPTFVQIERVKEVSDLIRHAKDAMAK